MVCPYALDRPGGVQTHVRDMAAALRARQHQVTLVAPPFAGIPPADLAAVTVTFGQRRSVLFNGTQFDVCAAWGEERRRLTGWLADTPFDVMHFHTIWDPVLPFQVLRRAGRAARVATFHDTPPDGFAGAATRLAFRAASRLLAPALDGVMAVSETPSRHLRLGRRPVIVPPARDLSRFRPDPARDDTRRRRSVLFLGRLEPRKGAGLLLDAYRMLRAEGVDLTLTIAGDGIDAPALRRRSEDLGLPDVTFLGEVADAAIPGLYAASDIFCAPSPYGESFGIVLVEAMAAGLPVVAAANPGYAAVLAEQAAHCLAAPGEVGALAGRLRDLAASPALCRTLERWGLSQARRYDCVPWVETVEQVYAEAIAARRRRVMER